MIITQEQVLSKVLQYLQHPRVVPKWCLQTSYSYYPTLAMHACLLIILPIICSTSKCLPTTLYYLQQTTSIPSHCLSLVVVHFSLQVVDQKGENTCWYSPLSFYHQVLVATFLWQLESCYSKSYQVICLFIHYSKGNVKIPCQGTTYLVHY